MFAPLRNLSDDQLLTRFTNTRDATTPSRPGSCRRSGRPIGQSRSKDCAGL